MFGYITTLTSRLLTTSSETGAQAQIYAATEESLEKRGDLSMTVFGPVVPLPYFPQTLEWTPPNPLFATDANAEKVWNWSKKIIQEKRGYAIDF